MRPRDIYAEIESKLPLNEFDRETMKGSGLPRWRAALHFHSVAASKAGLLIKSDGLWHVTEEGQKVASMSDDELRRLMRSRYGEWRWGNPKVRPDAEVPGTVDEASPPDTSVLFEHAKEKAREEIDSYLDTLGGYEFQELVAALLESAEYGHQHGLHIGTNIAPVAVAVLADDHRRTHLALGVVVVERDSVVIEEGQQVGLVSSQALDQSPRLAVVPGRLEQRLPR